ncbi:xanthine dehydrogenase family protein molybdopterin-binding subunit [Cupriavidus neocaledonicus]|uniref:Oxidoreductase with molybdenum-binding domain n=1 Tax=Cupriavidus neocaledonicus TaxID=1040979 RepID=A0A375H3F1_9BURK|nr:xanthine dehydrogenase family protein molybdopterin-binding subunit [Cupriavidus neocaledonicus]SOZ34624.1 putative oxidoreductase with molybdenum-binding domain [Cupriavidus neocaledonicus]SPD46451.1 putative oxidoreductase with molybdenum-binding domain [Cupriavidus neocaledonicus]
MTTKMQGNAGRGQGAPVGLPIDRVDGRLKVTGRATYAYEQPSAGPVPPAYGYIVGATIARGRIVAIDTRQARQAPGVIHVMTHRNAPAQPAFGPSVPPTPRDVFTRARPYLASDRVRYYDEPVALVVAESFEAARAAAALVQVRYQAEPGEFELAPRLAEAYQPPRTNAGFAPDSATGNFANAFSEAPVALDVTYATPYQSHNPMEPHATMAVWSDAGLTVYTGSQTLGNFQAGLAATLRIPPERVRIVSPFTGGGFGAKLIVHADTVLAALAARELRRPVKIALTRQQMYANAGHRAAMSHRVRLGADRDGRLSAMGYEVWSATCRFEEYCEQTAVFARALYAAPHRATRHRLVPVDLNRGEWMRSPGEAPGMLAFECAMDELTGLPYSTRNLVDCMRTGAARFGWQHRRAAPRSVREGRWLVGMGMAAAIRPNYLGAAAAQVAMDSRGRVTVRLDMTDIGTGTYTILTQIAAESLGVPLNWVRVELGDSRFPRTAGSGGSWGAASAGSAVADACTQLKARIVAAAKGPEQAAPAAVRFADGAVTLGGQTQRLDDLMARVAPGGLQAEGRVAGMGEAYKAHSHHAYGAHFAEVAVDADTGEIRMRRMLAVIGAGRILNPKTARSQILGGMTWGIGAALMEQTLLDTRYGNFINHDLAEYLVPVNGDVAQMEVVFLDQPDPNANPLGIKGLGELGVCGAGAAVANAVYNATGARVREFPVTLDKVLAGMAAAERLAL